MLPQSITISTTINEKRIVSPLILYSWNLSKYYDCEVVFWCKLFILCCLTPAIINVLQCITSPMSNLADMLHTFQMWCHLTSCKYTINEFITMHVMTSVTYPQGIRIWRICMWCHLTSCEYTTNEFITMHVMTSVTYPQGICIWRICDVIWNHVNPQNTSTEI